MFFKSLLLSLTLSLPLLSLTPFDELVTIYHKYGNEKYMLDEPITQKSHVLQAAHIAHMSGAPEEIIIALLFHDIGQLADNDNLHDIHFLHANHSEIGAQWLKERGFPELVWGFAEKHTLAKIALCEEEENYFSALSEASKDSFYVQKAKYSKKSKATQSEIERFRTDPNAPLYKVARKCDDMAKLSMLEEFSETLPSFQYYRNMVERVINSSGKKAQRDDWQEVIARLHNKMLENETEFQEIVMSENLQALAK